MTKPRLGWWLLVGSVILNIWGCLTLRDEMTQHKLTEDRLLKANGQCLDRLIQYAEASAIADAIDNKRRVQGWER
jgi:hypothetical protein